jgi:hypothetical protein
MRALGLLTGDIWRGLAGAPRPAAPTVLRHEVKEEATDTPAGRITLRRTTIEEVELAPASQTRRDK